MEINLGQVVTNVITQLGIWVVIWLVSNKILDKWNKKQAIREKQFIYQARKTNSILFALIRCNGAIPRFQEFYKDCMEKYSKEDNDIEDIILKH